MVFPVVVYGCESWTVKKAERRRIDAFKLWYWRRLSRVPWTARRSNQSILKETSPECSLEGLMLRLKLQYFGFLMWTVEKTPLIEKDPDAGRDWGQEEKGTTEDEIAGWHHWLDRREFEWTPGVGDGQGGLACCDSWGRKESDTTERLNWTGLIVILDHKESRVPKNWCFLPVVLEKTLESLLDCKEIKPVNPKGNQSWIFTGRTDADAEASKCCLPDAKN